MLTHACRRNFRVFCLMSIAIFTICSTSYILSKQFEIFFEQSSTEFSLNSVQDKLQVHEKKEERPWYLENGTKWPTPALIDKRTGRREAKLWPNEDPEADRVLNQLMFIPPNNTGKPLPIKKVFLHELIMPSRGLEDQQGQFEGCPVDRCVTTTDGLNADAILFLFGFKDPGHQRPANQIWIWYSHESPMNWFRERPEYENVFNWTISFRRASDLPNPYAKWVYYDPGQTEWQGAYRNFATGKSKQVAWFVSNCFAKNNRLEYARQLAKHIQVDMYGNCEAQYECRQENWSDCYEMLKTTYKFYLAFENSNCREYITEKFFTNSLRHNVIPIVMGPPKEDYLLVAPKNSFIHVEDFDSPADLAAYLHRLDKDDELYSSYFKWQGMGQIIGDTQYFCRLCAMLHDDYPRKNYENIDDWFREPDRCINGTWREYRERKGGLNPL